MRKVLIVLFMLVLMLAVPLLPSYASGIDLDGQILSEAGDAILIEEKLFIPARPLLLELGYQVSFDPRGGVIEASRSKYRVEILLWEPKLIRNGIEIVPDAAPQLINGITMISTKDLGRLLNLAVSENTSTEKVSFHSLPEMTKEGVIRHLIAADRQMMRAEYYNNQEFLKQCRVTPSPVLKNKEDLELLLSQYWAPKYINNLWQEGSKNGQYIGFFSEGLTPLIYSKEILVTELNDSEATVEVKLPLWGEEGLDNHEIRTYTLTKDLQGRLLIKNVGAQ